MRAHAHLQIAELKRRRRLRDDLGGFAERLARLLLALGRNHLMRRKEGRKEIRFTHDSEEGNDPVPSGTFLTDGDTSRFDINTHLIMVVISAIS